MHFGPDSQATARFIPSAKSIYSHTLSSPSIRRPSWHLSGLVKDHINQIPQCRGYSIVAGAPAQSDGASRIPQRIGAPTLDLKIASPLVHSRMVNLPHLLSSPPFTSSFSLAIAPIRSHLYYTPLFLNIPIISNNVCGFKRQTNHHHRPRPARSRTGSLRAIRRASSSARRAHSATGSATRRAPSSPLKRAAITSTSAMPVLG